MMNRLNLLSGCLCLTMLVLATAKPANGQYYWRGYGGGYHSSTAAEGAARGAADMTRSQGMRNLANSEAAINMTTAGSAAIDNSVKATNAYWERKRIYEENTAQERYERHLKNERQRARVKLQELSPEQLDPTSGAVQWPMLLRDANYEEFRAPLDQIFGKRGQYGALSSDDYLQAKQLIVDWRAAVTAAKTKLNENATRSALRFLLSLNRELDENLG